jgi:1-acyl-sn-glycerol-3-phosphate acyltransferase
VLYRVVWCIIRVLMVTLLRRRVHGAEHVPPRGAVIIASNHISNLDPPLVGTAIWRPFAFMAKEELFHNRFFGAFIRRLYAFPVRRGAPDRAALKQALDLLGRGWGLVMFPEGTRSEDGELKEPEMGVGMIALRSGVPVIPAYVTGTDQVMPKGGGIRLARVAITFGPPLRFTATEGEKPGREEYEAAAREIMAAIARIRDAHGRA